MLMHHDLLYLKELHKGHKIIYVLFNNREYVFKTLSRQDYEDVVKVVKDEYELEDAVCQCALIYPEEYDFSNSPLGGFSSHCSRKIIETSDFLDIKSVLRQYYEMKQKLNSFDEQCMSVVKASFPEYSYEEIKEWTWSKLIQMTARAEKSTSNKRC